MDENTSTTLTADELVVMRGALLLDVKAPEWASEIDLETLDLMSTDHCVVAQAFGGYWAGVRALRIEGDSALQCACGFDKLASHPIGTTWDGLHAAWLHEIEKRVND